MKASIIIPTYRRHGLLLKAMASAAAQSYPPSAYEVIVVNDGGSGTNRINVRAAWKGAASALQYVRIKHQGLSAAINRGIALSRAEYFTILPDDDALFPTKLRVMCDFLDAHPEADVAYSLPQYIDAKGNHLPTPDKLRTFLRAHPVLTWEHIRRGDGLWVHGTGTVYRRRVIESAGLWDEKLETSEEFEWHLRLLHAGHAFHAVDAVTTYYRTHGSNKSAEFSKRRAQYRKYIYGKFFDSKDLQAKVASGLTKPKP